MPRATATETAERVGRLQEMILAGQANTVCLAFMRQAWGVSRAQGYRLLKKAWAQIKDDIDETGIDRQELLSWAIQTLITASGQALKQQNSWRMVRPRPLSRTHLASECLSAGSVPLVLDS